MYATCTLAKLSPLSSGGSLSWKSLKSKGSAHINSSDLQTIIPRSEATIMALITFLFLLPAALANEP